MEVILKRFNHVRQCVRAPMRKEQEKPFFQLEIEGQMSKQAYGVQGNPKELGASHS
ncbi:hypothetical protein M413DRAFT_443152 [Hebeloma cylindrosporum]|uniref:Uncharacterized protein n=1 Tax=Hebeloma cylindrosporum TaxID=76867 RepID=A0A0C3CJ66_HEBCY|nr:hypothetical protein M413DRAFT_443152 [Hebeloma cylindrosporum h7]